jgi:S1-C subfamily serine protease
MVVLALVAAGQNRRIDQLQREAARDRRAAESAAAANDQRLAGIDKQVKGLETQLAALDERSRQTFDPRAVAASALPSVFQVVAGDFTGSAFAIGKPRQGRTQILTAYHVVEQVWTRGRTTVQLERDGKNYTATIADVSATHDLALLTIGAKINGIEAARATPASGEQILVVGAPLGLTDTITTGVVSAIRARVGGPGTMIQFDAPVNPGNSGGPVVNTRKEVVGIADAKAQDAEGISLAVPIQTACKVFDVC